MPISLHTSAPISRRACRFSQVMCVHANFWEFDFCFLLVDFWSFKWVSDKIVFLRVLINTILNNEKSSCQFRLQIINEKKCTTYFAQFFSEFKQAASEWTRAQGNTALHWNNILCRFLKKFRWKNFISSYYIHHKTTDEGN